MNNRYDSLFHENTALVIVDMVNGFLIESVKVSDIIKIDVPKREETVSLPVIGETSGFHIPEE